MISLTVVLVLRNVSVAFKRARRRLLISAQERAVNFGAGAIRVALERRVTRGQPPYRRRCPRCPRCRRCRRCRRAKSVALLETEGETMGV